ncbi:hypothetical protein AGMMS49546_24310 [Spirochaetia bacterium]|nr:hypothetical protein AGMMS49546_24310 [Spirochaetia bacterium]
MNEKITESARELEVRDHADILVAGGGIAGIAAALAAARTGSRVLLIEKEWMLGGLATLGLITIYLPLCDGKGRQVIYGIGEELLKLSIKYGAEDGEFPLPRPWLEGGSLQEKQKLRYQVQYHPWLFAICAEQLLKEAGVEILYGTSVCAVILNDKRIEALVIENKSGRSALMVKAVVDATGDADICKQSGVKTEQFGRGNVLASWHYSFSEGRVQLRIAGYAEAPEQPGAGRNEAAEGGERGLSKRRFTGLDGKELSEMTEASHKALLNIVEKERLQHPDYFPVTAPLIPQIRMTRRISGEYTLDESEALVHFDDSIGLTGDWRKPGPVFEIPYRTLYSREIKNLICAGRCISVTDPMWDISRVIPPCAVTGQAAGTAAALALQGQKEAGGGIDFFQLAAAELQQKLSADGVLIHLKDIDIHNGKT